LEPDSLARSIRHGRVLLKHHFLYVCIEANPVTAKTFANDHTRSYYLDLLSSVYSMTGITKLWAYKKCFVRAAAFESKNPTAEHKGATIFSNCIYHYESKQLDDFVRSLDQYR
jgi:hypothetical protein